MGIYDADEKREAMDLKLRVETTIDKKIERGIAKELITDADAKALQKALKKASKQHDVEWWLDEKIYKSYEIATHLLNEGELLEFATELEILQKIEKA